jgi:hypothetical protein
VLGVKLALMAATAVKDFSNCTNSLGCIFRLANLLVNLSKSPQDSMVSCNVFEASLASKN